MVRWALIGISFYSNFGTTVGGARLDSVFSTPLIVVRKQPKYIKYLTFERANFHDLARY